MQAYQNAPLGSVEFKLRLLGLVAVAIHDLAIQTFTRLHPYGGPSHPMKVPQVEGISVPDLSHPNYMCRHQYPHGTAELVGYFAESEILGGTVVFEHDSESEEVVCVSSLSFFLPAYSVSLKTKSVDTTRSRGRCLFLGTPQPPATRNLVDKFI